MKFEMFLKCVSGIPKIITTVVCSEATRVTLVHELSIAELQKFKIITSDMSNEEVLIFREVHHAMKFVDLMKEEGIQRAKEVMQDKFL